MERVGAWIVCLILFFRFPYHYIMSYSHQIAQKVPSIIYISAQRGRFVLIK